MWVLIGTRNASSSKLASEHLQSAVMTRCKTAFNKCNNKIDYELIHVSAAVHSLPSCQTLILEDIFKSNIYRLLYSLFFKFIVKLFGQWRSQEGWFGNIRRVDRKTQMLSPSQGSISRSVSLCTQNTSQWDFPLWLSHRRIKLESMRCKESTQTIQHLKISVGTHNKNLPSKDCMLYVITCDSCEHYISEVASVCQTETLKT